MPNNIHKTAIISESAKIADNVQIGPYAVIEGEVSIGENTTIGAHSVIKEYTYSCAKFSSIVGPGVDA